MDDGDAEVPEIPEAIGSEPVALPDPAERMRPGARGFPVAIGGVTWLLADYRPSPGGVWDRLYDQAVLGGAKFGGDILLAASHLLAENYDLTTAEAFALTVAADPAAILEPVRFALFGPEKETAVTRRTLSQWERLSWRAARIEPETVPPWDRRAQLDYLVQLGVILPQDKWISSAEAVAWRARREAQE